MKILVRMLPLSLTLVVNASASAQVIVNGSFEDPLVPVGWYTNFSSGSTVITGWTVVGVDSAVVSRTFTQSGITFNAQSGNQWVDLAGVTANSTTSGVTQSVTTVIGQAYEVSFYVGSATGGGIFFPATVDLSINGGGRTSYSNPTAPSNMLNWRSFTVPFTAASTTTSLTFYNGSASNNFLSALDNVSLVETGEAVTGTLILQDTVGSFAAPRAIGYAVMQGTTNLASGSVMATTSSTPIAFTLSGAATGPAVMIFDGSSFLKRTVSLTLTGGAITFGTVSCQNGDVDNSGEVDAADIDAVIADFGGTATGTTDVDVSGEVDAADIDIAIANFGSVDM